MDFTREPIIESVIVPKEGCKLVVRSSKHAGLEEYFVDAVEMVSFGRSLFFRSKERPKAFLVPATDYEILEVREARMVLKNISRDSKPAPKEKPEAHRPEKPVVEAAAKEESPVEDIKIDKKRERRRHLRRRRSQETPLEDGVAAPATVVTPENPEENDTVVPKAPARSPEEFSSLLRPPPTLISETISRYKENAMFRGAFFTPEEQEAEEKRLAEESDVEEETLPSLSSVASEEEEIARIREERAHYELEPTQLELFEDLAPEEAPLKKKNSRKPLQVTEESLIITASENEELPIEEQAHIDPLVEETSLPERES